MRVHALPMFLIIKKHSLSLPVPYPTHLALVLIHTVRRMLQICVL